MEGNSDPVITNKEGERRDLPGPRTVVAITGHSRAIGGGRQRRAY